MRPTSDRRGVRYPALWAAAFLIVLFLAAGGAQARAEGGRQIQNASQLLANLSLQGVACPDARTCFAVGTRVGANGPDGELDILATHNGGASWSTTREQVGAAGTFLGCPRPSRCYVISWSNSSNSPAPKITLLRTADAGKTWQRSTLSTGRLPGFDPFSITCPSSTVCYIAGIAILGLQPGSPQVQASLMMTKDGGKSWMVNRLPATLHLGLRVVACPSVTSCYVGGVVQDKSCFQAAAIVHTGDGGRTWTRQFNECAAGITVLACPTAVTCYAGGWYGVPSVGGSIVLRTGDSGATWDEQLVGSLDTAVNPGGPTTGPFSIFTIACPGAQTCFLPLGGDIFATTDEGATWTGRHAVSSAYVSAIACPTVRICVAVGTLQAPGSGPGPPQMTGVIVRTVDGGKTWTRL